MQKIVGEEDLYCTLYLILQICRSQIYWNGESGKNLSLIVLKQEFKIYIMLDSYSIKDGSITLTEWEDLEQYLWN